MPREGKHSYNYSPSKRNSHHPKKNMRRTSSEASGLKEEVAPASVTKMSDGNKNDSAHMLRIHSFLPTEDGLQTCEVIAE